MKCICRRACQQRVGEEGKIVFFTEGQTEHFSECPEWFEPLEGEGKVAINFNTAEKEELFAADYDLKDLKEFIEKKYDKKAGNKGMEKTVKLLLDCRFRETPGEDLDKLT